MLRKVVQTLIVLLLLGAGAVAQSAGTVPGGDGIALLLKLDGPVSPATADYVVRGLKTAETRGARLVILQMDTPGGLDTSMRDIIHAILASPVPVASYVAPSGARAASAGTYIMYASHIAAMAPSTNLGAATPISLGGGGGLPFGGGQQPGSSDSAGGGKDTGPTSPKTAEEAKAMNDAVAYIRGLATLRGRNVQWAESAVRQAESLTATAARDKNVIDFVVADVNALLEKADGRTVKLDHGKEVTLHTAGLRVETLEPDWRTQFLSVITNPNVALILMTIGVYGLIFEFLNPGSLVPGTIGIICLITGLYALAVLPVSYAGVGLFVLGALLVVAEAFAPSFGILGISGTVSLALGATILVNTDVPGFGTSWSVIAGIAVGSLLLSLTIAWLAVQSHRRRSVSGSQTMIGAQARVIDWKDGHGLVLVHGERWRAVCKAPLRVGETVTVEGLDGLTLEVAAAPHPA